MRTIALASLALVAFAANSLLCRLALRDTTIDPATFSTIRLTAGALTLLVIAAWSGRPHVQTAGSWRSAATLALYAVPFSFAYTNLSAATGALIMFGSVQATMLCAAVWAGERPASGVWIGLSIALAGLTYLVFPGLTAPSPAGAALMGLAGLAWGLYSLQGRAAADPLAQTTANFARSIPFAGAASLLTLAQFRPDARGALLAAASGALASGLGYVVWYAAVRRLTAVRASVVQLAVPILTAVGGVTLLGEGVTLRLAVAAALVLGGIALAILRREPVTRHGD